MATVLSPISSRSLCDLEDLDRLPGEQTAPVLVEQLRLDAGRLELAQVLLAKALVGCEQDDPVQLAPPAVLRPGSAGYWRMLACISSVLPLPVALQKASLLSCGQASASSSKRRDLVGLGLVGVVGGDLRVQRREQRLGIAEVAVEVDFGEEQRQVLEVLPDDRLLAARDAPLVQPLRVLDDVLVVLEQQLGRQLRQVEELRGERVVEVMDVVLVQPFQRLVAQVLGQLLEALDVEQREQPLVQHQLVGERHLWLVVGAAVGGVAARLRAPCAITRPPSRTSGDGSPPRSAAPSRCRRGP